MRKRTVRTGLISILAGVILITSATFYHTHAARIFLLSDEGETVYILLGLISGGGACCFGILVSLIGALLRNGNDREIRLSPVMILISATIAIFFFLFFMSISGNKQPGMQPGEFITI